MALRPVYLLIDNRTAKSRGHFSIFIPNASSSHAITNQPPPSSGPSSTPSTAGTAIHVVGNPLIGFHHEFKRNYNPQTDSISPSPPKAVPLGHIGPSLHVDPASDTTTTTTAKFSTDTTPLGILDAAALGIPCPGKSDIRAPVDGIHNKRCQEWTTEYIQHLVSLGHLHPSAIQLVQEQRDPPTHGVMLRREETD